MSYSVVRGITVDGTTLSSMSPGSFSASHSNTNEFGMASASISSEVAEGLFAISGWAQISAASHEEFSAEERAVLFLDATISIAQPYHYDLKGLLIGTTEAEHWVGSVTLLGPATNIAHSAWNQYLEIEETGTLGPGDYVFSIRAEPIVLGGLDGGSATAYVAGGFEHPDLTLVLTPVLDQTNNVPEPSVMASIALLSMISLAMRPASPR